MKEFKPENYLTEDISIEELSNLPIEFIEKKAILGIDIYKYSQYPPLEQIYIPVVFELLYQETAHNLIKNEKALFTNFKSKNDFKKSFISTGDGGFQIFDNVIQAIVFAIYFQAGLKRFSTGGSNTHRMKNLNKVVKSIELRYAITLDEVYKYTSNFFGPGIINNARVLSKDSLNRVLIDANSVDWLNENINSVENLLILKLNDLKLTNYFSDIDDTLSSHLFKSDKKIISVDLQKVGLITAKQTEMNVYNLHIQANLNLNVAHQNYDAYVITLGNLNTSGIN